MYSFQVFSIALWVSIIDGHSLSDKMHHDYPPKCIMTAWQNAISPEWWKLLEATNSLTHGVSYHTALTVIGKTNVKTTINYHKCYYIICHTANQNPQSFLTWIQCTCTNDNNMLYLLIDILQRNLTV